MIYGRASSRALVSGNHISRRGAAQRPSNLTAGLQTKWVCEHAQRTAPPRHISATMVVHRLMRKTQPH
jgi:hypothetical protein